MRTIKTIALVLAALTVAAALCACSVNNPNYTVLKVGDMDIGVNAYYNNYNYLAYVYQMYGLYNVSTQEAFRSMQDQVFNNLINNALPVVIAKREGVTLTAEEEAKVQEDYKAQLESMIAGYADKVDASITDEAEKRKEEEKLFKADLKKAGWIYSEYLQLIEDDVRNTAIGNKYLQTLYKDVNITEVQAQEYYDEQLILKKAEYSENPAKYYDDYTAYISGSDEMAPLTVAEGYHFYKHILIKKPAEGETKDVNKIIEEVKAKLADGVDFDTLVADYGEDPGMQSDPYKSTGYPISEAIVDKYYEGFAEAALALENIGDVSEPVETEAGYHFIQYTSDAEVKDTPFEDVKEAIINKLTEDEKSQIYNDALEQWKTEVKIEKYYDRVSGIK